MQHGSKQMQECYARFRAMNDMRLEINRPYQTEEELLFIIQYAAIRPIRTVTEYAQLIRDGVMKPFVSDGPSDYGARYLLALMYPLRYRSCIKAIEEGAGPHDIEFYFGNESGTSFAQSNQRFGNYIREAGFEWAGDICQEQVTKHGMNPDKPYRWGFGWVKEIP
jgi:hypothetical protein